MVPFINFAVKVFFSSIFEIYCFYQIVINFVQLAAFRLFSEITNKSKNTIIKDGNLEVCNENFCIAIAEKLLQINH